MTYLSQNGPICTQSSRLRASAPRHVWHPLLNTCRSATRLRRLANQTTPLGLPIPYKPPPNPAADPPPRRFVKLCSQSAPFIDAQGGLDIATKPRSVVTLRRAEMSDSEEVVGNL